MSVSDKFLYRILSGYTRIKVDNKLYFVRGNTIDEKYLAEEYYEELCEKLTEENTFNDTKLMNDSELLCWLVDNKLWSSKDEESIKTFKKNLEELQVKLFQLNFKGREKVITKDLIKQTREKLTDLHTRRHSHDYLTISGTASIERNKYLLAMGLCDENKQSIYSPSTFWNTAAFSFLEKIIIKHASQSISTQDYRKIARSELWRQYWNARESSTSLFGIPANQLTTEQLTLISWTKLYDNIYQHPECPADEIVEDDDAIDGFLILENRKRNKLTGDDYLAGITQNERIRNANEIFLPFETEEDAQKITSLNTDSSMSIIKQREKVIAQKGKVSEADLPDVAQRLQMKMAQLATQAIKSRTN